MKAVWVLGIIFVITCGFWAAPTYADYHYASHDGSNEYPYTSWATGAHVIQDAINATDPHDTLYIGSGNWYGSSATGVYDSVAIIGMGIDSTFCYSDSHQTAVMAIDYGCSVEKITFQHLDSWKCILAWAYAGVKISECKFVKSSIGIQSGGGPSEITDCIFDSCGVAVDLPIWLGDYYIANNLVLYSQGNWAFCLQAQSAIVENNIFINEPNSDISTVACAPDYAIIRNNVVIYGNTGFGAGASQRYNNIAMNMKRISSSWGLAGGEDDTLYNNLTVNCNRGIRLNSSPNIIVNYNAFWRNQRDIYGVPAESIGNVYADPMLISEEDFHLQAYSPLIDAGDPDVFDVDGSRSDIGIYGGPLGETYEYLDLPPAIPDSISGEIVADTIFINWLYNTEADFNQYSLHRDTVSGFTPSVFNLISEPDSSFYADTDVIPDQSYYYKISAMDNQGNMSDYSGELALIPTGIWNGVGVEPPRITTIKGNYPNPFNSRTTIVYYVANLGPIPAEIDIAVYDIGGRKVRTLLHERKELGVHRIIWDGRSDGGSECPSGVYFAKIVQWDLGFLGRHQKLVLIR